jgi:hypothetical protein
VQSSKAELKIPGNVAYASHPNGAYHARRQANAEANCVYYRVFNLERMGGHEMIDKIEVWLNRLTWLILILSVIYFAPIVIRILLTK